MKLTLHVIPVLSAALIAPSLGAQSDGSTSLTVSSFQTGDTVTAALRSTEVGQPAVMVFGQPALIGHTLPNPLQLVDHRGGHVFSGTIAANGIFEAQRFIRPQVDLSGVLLFGQGFVLHRDGHYLATNRTAILGNTTQTSPWAEANQSLPATASNYAGSDADAVDIDRDGDLDLLVTNNQQTLIYVNQGGGFVDETITRFPSNNFGAFSTALLDVDLDGDIDFVNIGGMDMGGTFYRPQIFLNDGFGYFSKSQELLSPLTRAQNLIVGDFNHDGYPDVLIGEGSAYGASGIAHQYVSLFFNQGGTLALDAHTETAAWNMGDREWMAADAGDIDNDGDLDLYFAMTGGGYGGANILLENDGTGVFTDVSSVNLPIIQQGDGDKSSAARFFDANGDGYLDVIVANSHLSVPTTETGDLLLNEGASNPGYFQDAQNNWLALADSEAVINLGFTLGDVDLDGDVDVILHPCEWFGTTLPFVGHPILFLNQGGAQGGTEGEFEKDHAFWTPGPMTTFFTSYGALFDADADGDLDFYVPAMGGIVDPTKTQDYFFVNLVR